MELGNMQAACINQDRLKFKYFANSLICRLKGFDLSQTRPFIREGGLFGNAFALGSFLCEDKSAI